jgi:serine/threonine protein kinase/Tfp pilus assembly protein PilF
MDQPGASQPQPQREVKDSPLAGESSAPFSPLSPALAAEPDPIRIPTVPDYDLLRRIGRGAYGDVWLARSQATGALRAAKIVWRHTFEDSKPFQREFAGIQRFERISREHPSQLALFHIGRNEPAGYFYYVMELADAAEPGPTMLGRDVPIAPRRAEDSPRYQPHTLRADLEKGRLPAAKVLEIGLALSEALSHLHSNGLVHRDVKPSNVIFVNGRPKLADIGLVTDASDQCSIVGTEGYLPPEGPGTPQADIFALGKVLYEAATGLDRREFPKLPEDLREWPDAAQVFELNEVILKACAQDAKERYQTCGELHADLALLEQGESVKKKRTRQQRWAVAKKVGLGLIILVLLAAILPLLSRQSQRSEYSSDGSDSTNMEANAYCDKGLLILRGDNYTEVGEAYADFTNAIRLDPNYARPYVGLLELQVREDVGTTNVPNATIDDMRLIARHLEQLAPNLPATHIAQAVVNHSDLKFAEAEHCMQEAIKADPNYEFAHTYYSWLLDCYGRPGEALAQLEISRKIAPSKVIVLRCFGNSYYVARDFTNAIAWYKKTIAWEPHHSVAWMGVGNSLRAQGDYTNALPYLETNDVLWGAEPAKARNHYAQLRRAMDEQGIRGYWLTQMKWAEGDTNATSDWKAEIQIHLGNTNTALDLLEKCYTGYATHERGNDIEPPLGGLLYDADWDGLRDHPRFKKLLDEIGYTKVMQPPKK